MRILSFFILFFVSGCLGQGNFSDRQKNYNQRASAPEWQPDKVIESLAIQKGWFIGDLGAGGGYYTFRLAAETGAEGKVFAADIDKSFLQNIKKEAEERGIKNITTILASEDNSNFEDQSLDMIFIRNTFHHFKDRNNYMRRLAQKIKKDGRIVIIDYKTEMATYSGHNVTRDEILDAIKNSGLEIDKEFNFIERQYFFVFKNAQ